ncbi:MAG TPA: alpha/beta fold hydrolase [Pyrinomonadaceae bacterium]|nr:alpha/beta fold hydrolase [Pyrinomonadaceae bacterium]
MRRTTILSSLIIAIVYGLFIQVPEVAAWERTISDCALCGSGAHSAVVDAAGDVITLGGFYYGSDVVKLSKATGEIMWRFNVSGHESRTYAQEMAIDSNGDVFVVFVWSRAVLKVSGATGKLVWQGTIGVTSPNAFQPIINAVAVDRDNNVVTAGTVGGLLNVSKLRGTNGAEMWRYEREGNAYDVAVDTNGNVAAAGLMNRNFAAVRLNGSNGSEIWQREINGAGNFSDDFEIANAVAVDAGGNVLVAGVTSNVIANFRDFTVAKYAPNGTRLWLRIIDGDFSQSNDIANAVVADSDGDVIAAGSIQDDDPAIPGRTEHFHVIKFSGTTGNTLWSKSAQEKPFGEEDTPGQAYALSVNAYGNIVASGSHGNTFTIVKFWGSTGGRAWRHSSGQYDTGGNTARSVVMDDNSDVIAAGQITASNGWGKYTVIKLRREDGTTYAAPQPPPSLTPVIFVPGISGSYLVAQNPVIELWLGNQTTHRYLSLDPTDPSYDIRATDVIRKAFYLVSVYEPLLDKLHQAGYVEGGSQPKLFVFPYDWRKSNADNSVKLKDLVTYVRAIHPNSKVNIVAHSMGGVLARRYIIDNPDPSLHHVDKLITVATPFLGAPKALLALETGEFMDGIQQLFAKRSTIKSLLEFFPGAHELMPSEAYYNSGGLPFEERGWDINGDGISSPQTYSYQQVYNLYNNRHPRSTPASTGATFHNKLGQDDWRNFAYGVHYYHLYGRTSKAETIRQVIAKRGVRCTPSGIGFDCDGPFIFSVAKFENGDKTVPVLSATRIGNGLNLNASGYYELKRFDENNTDGAVDHTGLVKNPDVQQKVLDIMLTPSSATQTPKSDKFTTESAQTDPPETEQAYYLQVSGVKGASLTDSMGRASDVLGDAPGADMPHTTSYKLSSDTFLAIMSINHAYYLTFTTGTSPVTLELTKGTDIETLQAIRYLDLSLPPNTLARLEITPEGVGTLQYDQNGDGTFETPITPTVSITGTAAQDTDAPLITFDQVAQTPTSTRVTITASDSGAGVRSVFYSLNGVNFQPYLEPLNLNPAQTSAVYAFASDNVANRSGLVTFKLALPKSALQFSAASYSANEGDGGTSIVVTRVGHSSVAASVDFQTVDDPAAVPCNPALKRPDGSSYPQGAAYARCDYATSIETVTFAAGDTQPKTITIPLIDDAYVEGAETVQLKLLNPSGATLGAHNTVDLTITDNDTAGAQNPISSTSFFVRMHYLDFLSREPETGEPWSGVLNRCANPFNLDPHHPAAACDRILVSQSFFGSPEFRLKGFYVFTFYRVAFNRRPAYEEIIPDMRSVSGATPEEVYQKRAALPVNFTTRPEFKGLYDALGNAAFVNTLLDRYGLQSIRSPDTANPEGGTRVVLTRADLITRLGSTGGQSLTRAQVLRSIVESDEVGAAEYNRAFVAMQYYGYLRRTPEEDGYNAWLRVINEDPQNVRIMVNGFMNSTEYRLRFGQP